MPGLKISTIGLSAQNAEYSYPPFPVPHAVNPDDSTMLNPDTSESDNPS